MFWSRNFSGSGCFLLLVLTTGGWVTPAGAVILWNNPDTITVHETGPGEDILGGAVKRDNTANDTLYFKFHVDPLSDKDTEEYFAGFELYDGDVERLGIGNALKASAYSAYFHAGEAGETAGSEPYIDLRSLKSEPSAGGAVNACQYPQRGSGITIVFKVQYVPHEDDLVTVWLNPDLGPGATEVYQPEGLTTRFNASAPFDEIRLRHGGRGDGWTFSDMAVATSFSDFVDMSSARLNETTAGVAGGTLSYNFQSWQKGEGLPQGPVRTLLQTRDGYLWAGGNDGVTRFDGMRFVTYGIAEGIDVGRVGMLFEDDEGALWVGGASGGLIRWHNDEINSFTPRNGLPAGSITALAEDPAGRLWIGTETGLVLWQRGRLSPVPPADTFKGMPITFLFKDSLGKMWLGVKGEGVFQWANGQLIRLAGGPEENLLKDSHCLLVDQAGRIWMSAGEDSILCDDAGRWNRYRVPRNLAKSHVTTLAEGPEGTVWAGSVAGGLLQFKSGEFAAVTASIGLAGDKIESLLKDRQGNLWVGTDAGLNRLQPKSLFAFGQNEGLGFGPVQGLAEVAPGVIWAAKPNGSLYRWNGESFSWLTSAGSPPRDSRASVMLVTHDGRCWVATANNLLLYKDPTAAADEVEAIKQARPGIISLAEDAQGNLWAGTGKGKIWQLSAGKWRELADFLQTNAVTALVPARDGSMWAGTDGSGLYRFKNGGREHFGRSEGLLSNAVRTLYLDAQDTLWIGTATGGLSRWRDGRIVNFTTREGLPDNNISQILEDDTGRLWLGSDSGIACIGKSRLDELAAGKIPAVTPLVFGRKEGMLSEECTGGFGPAGLKTKAGLLWFSTLKGVVMVDPRIALAPVHPPATLLEEVLVDGAPQAVLHDSNPLRIPPGKHQIEFRYTSPDYDAPEQMRYRYRLEGLDSDWVEAGTRRTAFYSYLPPGDYRFRVTAWNGDGGWEAGGAELKLTVLRHFWQAWWLLVLMSLGLLTFVVVSVRFLEKRKLRHRLKFLEQERALEQERTRIAQDLHDEMGAKLCRISFLSEHARRGNLLAEELHDQITSISVASREVLHSLDEIVWAVNPHNDSLEHVAAYIGQYAQEYFQMTGVQCELDIPPELPPYALSSQVRHHLFLATHEALTNTLKHSGATHVRVSMASGNAQFEINVSDNGRGFDPGRDESRRASPAGTPGDGLPNMRRRLAEVGGQCWIESAAGQGTQIRFIIPLNFSQKKL
jgi:ligand-binding sensor domain-containing protein/signal transduction histidine kinase